MKTIDLSGAWILRRAKNGESVPARVPGDTHSALAEAGRIPDPYVGTNELDVQWVGREDWLYERAFDADGAFLEGEMIYLDCGSLDTIAEITVNGKPAGVSENMFAAQRFEVKRLLKKGRNTIRIMFRSAEIAAIEAAKALPYEVPHSMNPVQSPHRNLIRKVQCHSGWDWGPCLMVAGVAGGISLVSLPFARIEHVYTEQRHTAGTCRVKVTVETLAARDGPAELTVELGQERARRQLTLRRGTGTASVELNLVRPRLWWPNGYGEQPLYDLTVSLDGHEVKKRLGMRTLELVNREDEGGLSMTFRVNGTDVFCKGANWIPCDSLPQRQTREHLDRLLDSAARANMNMLRVWGGGQYESDAFYELCDEKGILIWQDMMFSCSLYPATPQFLENVEQEVRYQAKRLRDHACLALWCGNNEDVGALNWYPVSRKNRDRYLVDYDRLNEGVIGKTLDACDPTHAFWPSSPCGGRGDYSDNWHDDSRGDMHYWSVWHEGKSFDAFYAVTPRFCSEFGYQSFPSLATIRSYAPEADWNVTSPVMEHHQRHPRGNANIVEMFTRYFRVPEGFDNFVYLSQVQQALAIKTAVEYWRSLRPLCMGTLYWQLDDCWPVCSWSSLEYGGKWKLLHYAARRFYEPVMVCVYRSTADGPVEIWAVNDRKEPVSGTLTTRVLGFDGKTRKRERMAVRLPAGGARKLKAYRSEALAPAPGDVFLRVELKTGAGLATNDFFFAPWKACALQDAEVKADVRQTAGGFRIKLSTDKPALFVSLDADGVDGELDDNCITLLSGEPRELTFTPRGRAPSLAGFRKALRVYHLRATYR